MKTFFSEDSPINYVVCLGEGCPLCEKKCKHEYIKAINYQIEDGVECEKCGKLWVPHEVYNEHNKP